MANLPVPNPRTATAGEFETAAYMNAFRDALNFALNPPEAVVFQTTVQSLPNSTFAAISFDSTTVDTYGGHSNTTNNTRYTAQVAGWYWCAAQVCYDNTSSTGARQTFLAKNGTRINTAFQCSLGTATSQGVSVGQLVQLNVGDYVEVQGWQSSGGALNTFSAQSSLSVDWRHA